jgi:hypothetical protein
MRKLPLTGKEKAGSHRGIRKPQEGVKRNLQQGERRKNKSQERERERGMKKPQEGEKMDEEVARGREKE